MHAALAIHQPIPFLTKMVSVITMPAIMPAKSTPEIVMTGRRALRRAWIATRCPMPISRAASHRASWFETCATSRYVHDRMESTIAMRSGARRACSSNVCVMGS